MDARCLVAVLLACPVLAQTFVVDASNGPGTTWTDLGTATAAAPAGATLLVRPGQYGSFTIANKSLTILGDPGALVADGTATIGPTASTQRVALRGLHFDYQFPAHFNAVVATNCAGPVLLEGLTTDWPPVSLLTAQSCAQVTLRNVTATEVVCLNTSILLEGCVVSGPDAIVFRNVLTAPPRAALSLTSSTAQIAHSALRGGWGWAPSPPVGTITLNAPAVLANHSSIRVLGASTLIGANTIWPTLGSQVVQSSGGTVTLRLDPQVVLTTTAVPAIGPGIATQTVAMPDLRTVGGALGSTMTATTRGPIGHLVFVLLSLPAPTRFIPGIADPFWIDDAAHQVFAVGLPQLGAPVVGGGTVPNDPWLRGQMIVWQSVSYDHVATVQASNPSPVVLR